MQNCYWINKECVVNLNQSFKCGCYKTYGSHRLYFCICPFYYNDLVIEKLVDCKMMNEQWMKFCVQRTYLDDLCFRGSMGLFSFNDIAQSVNIYWSYRNSLILMKWMIKSLSFLASQEVYYSCYQIIEHFTHSAYWYCLCDEYQDCLREESVLSCGLPTLGADYCCICRTLKHYKLGGLNKIKRNSFCQEKFCLHLLRDLAEILSVDPNACFWENEFFYKFRDYREGT